MPLPNQHYLSVLFDPKSLLIVGNYDLLNLKDWTHSIEQRATQIKFDEQLQETLPDTLNGVADHERVDLAIVYVAKHLLSPALAMLAQRPPKAMIVLSPLPSDEDNRICRQWGMDHECIILGPNSFGLQRPSTGLNVSYHPKIAKTGAVAVISQSRSLTASILDWADDNSTAFSTIVSLGTEAMLDVPEVLDFLATDPKTDSIALYLEDISDARRFMSALRAASSVKPVVVLKAGRYMTKRSSVNPLAKDAVVYEPIPATDQISGDLVFDSAIRRAGAVRVKQFVQLFSAVKALSIPKRTTGRRLAVVANGSGLAQLAFDMILDNLDKVEAAQLSASTSNQLAIQLGATAWVDNPIVSFEALNAHMMTATLDLLQRDTGVDGIIVLIAPDPSNPDHATLATAIADTVKNSKKPIVANFVGDASMRSFRQVLDQVKCPSFRTPEAAVDAFSSLASYHYNQTLLLQIPADEHLALAPDIQGAQFVVNQAHSEKRLRLSEPEAKSVLGAFHVPIVPSLMANSPAQAVLIAQQLGYPVALKIASLDIPKKSAINGVQLDIRNANEMMMAYHRMIQDCQTHAPHATILGMIIQPMINAPGAIQLSVGVARDALFGPVIYISTGEITDSAYTDVELAPLNRYLARQLIERSKVWQYVRQGRVNSSLVHQLESTLICLSELASNMPDIATVDINPLILSNHSVVALDCQISLYNAHDDHDLYKNYEHMAIHPYPTRLVQNLHFKDGLPYFIRPIKPEDATALQEFTRSLSSETRYMRFISAMRELSPSMLKRYTQIDYSRELALVATVLSPVKNKPHTFKEEVIGVARYLLNKDNKTAEYALVIGDQWQKRGLGIQLMKTIIQGAREQGLKRLEGFVLKNNSGMQKLMQALEFINEADPDDDDMRYIYLDLD